MCVCVCVQARADVMYRRYLLLQTKLNPETCPNCIQKLVNSEMYERFRWFPLVPLLENVSVSTFLSVP